MCLSPFISHHIKAGLYHDVWNQEQKSQLTLYRSLQSNRKPFYFDFKNKAQKIYEDAYTKGLEQVDDNVRFSMMRASDIASQTVEQRMRPLFEEHFVQTGLHFASVAYTSSRNYKDRVDSFTIVTDSNGKIVETDRYWRQISDVFVLINGKRRNVIDFDGNKIILSERLRVSEGDTGTLLTSNLSDAIRDVIRNSLISYSASTIVSKLLGVTNTTRALFNINNVQDQTRAGVSDYIQGLIRRNARERAAQSALTETTASSNMGLQEGAKQVKPDVSKIWVSRQDDRVRETHGPLLQDQNGTVLLGADGLEVPIGQPYVIRNSKGGFDRLMYPGDTALGATLGNIINCRCYEQFKL